MRTCQVTGIEKREVHWEAELPAAQARKAYPLYLTVRRVGEVGDYGGDFIVDLEKPGLRLDQWGLFSPGELNWIGGQLANFKPKENV